MARLTVEFQDETSGVLEALAKENHTSKREILRRSLALYKYLADQGLMKVNSEDRLSITDKEGRVKGNILFTG